MFLKGIGGKYCENLLENGDNLCSSSPCWNGGVCLGNKTHWRCLCPENNTGMNCKNFTSKNLIYNKILIQKNLLI